MNESISFVGLDVHKRFIQVAALVRGEVLEWRTPNTPPKVSGLVRKLRRLCGGPIQACYEAGPTGYGLARRLNSEDGVTCMVVAPALIPRKAGERVKTDRRDAKKLAEYLRADLLTEVQAPTPEDEARREISRARDAAKTDEKKARQRLSKFLLRHGRRYTQGKKAWTKMYMVWLDGQRFDIPHLQTAFDSLLRAVTQASDRLRELDRALEVAARDEAVKTQVELLKCFKGVQTTTAMGIVTELYSFERFASPKELMSFIGMTPSEHTTGGPDKAKRGGITKSGNGRLRRLLIEAAWNYTKSNKAGYRVRTRREGQPGWAIDIAEKAQARLARRYWYLVGKGKSPNVAAVAVARELIGFIWVMLAMHTHRAEEARA